MSRTLPGSIISIVILASIGCGGTRDPLDRIAVRGKVTSASGEPLKGMISFLPEGETKGPAATTSLIDGKYRFDNRNGPVAGKYRVLVVENPSDQKAKAIESAPPPKNQPMTPAEWSVMADVSSDNVQFDFDVPQAPSTETRR